MNIYKGSEWNRWDLHVHTASSYDYKYKGPDADDLLCETLIRNEIKAVAITDHFLIDKDRIESLRTKAPDIVFFPGVELRTDKGANNLHVILIFPEDSDLKTLSEDFDAIMLRSNAKSADSDETIYWAFDDIIDFSNKHDALVTIHAGRKTNGIDKEIANALPVKEAIKEDIAKSVDFFEIGQKRDVDDYEKHVFKYINRKPLIMCSDCHNPKEYAPKEALWIKADITFAGLKQCLYQPLERVFIGVIPPMLDRVYKNKQANISAVSVKRVNNPGNDMMHWFNFEMQLNPGMIAVIGNKGSGKSAFSDILGHLCKSRTMDSASFLNDKRFRKPPKNFADDYTATITWTDGESRSTFLKAENYGTTIEDAQYLPQKYIEDVCNDIEDVFQQEIDKVIFSYVDRSERGDAINLDELVKQKSRQLEIKVQANYAKLQELNSWIIKLETKKTNDYMSKIADSLKKFEDILLRHEKSRPIEVKKPDITEMDAEYQAKLEELNQKILEKKQLISDTTTKITKINVFIDDINALIAQIDLLEVQFGKVKEAVSSFIALHALNEKECILTLTSPREYFVDLAKKSEEDKKMLQSTLSASDSGLTVDLQKLEEQKNLLISSADTKEKLYQKYLADLEEWEKKKSEIIGDKDTDDTLVFYRHENEYIVNILENEYTQAIAKRDELVRQLYCDKAELVNVYQSIYSPVQGEISALLGGLEDSIDFQAEIFMRNSNIAQDTLKYINQRYNGKFGRSKDSYHVFDKILRGTDFNNIESVLDFIHSIAEVVTEDLENADKKISDRQGFYDFIYGLSYIGVNFKLKMGGRNLDELSPGERGIVLLIFYLALSKESKPIIIDQPEDNLDNQSVYSKLVPCISKAKQRRQVIIVTHNPNIAVACDAEQIIYCEMDKNTYQIRYESGAIENPGIRKHVIDVLEGTMPAFDLRKQKYN